MNAVLLNRHSTKASAHALSQRVVVVFGTRYPQSTNPINPSLTPRDFLSRLSSSGRSALGVDGEKYRVVVSQFACPLVFVRGVSSCSSRRRRITLSYESPICFRSCSASRVSYETPTWVSVALLMVYCLGLMSVSTAFCLWFSCTIDEYGICSVRHLDKNINTLISRGRE